MVFKENLVIPVGVQRHQLGRGVHQPRGGNGLFRNLIHTRQEIVQRGLALAVRLDLIDAVAVRRLDQKHRIRDRLPGVGIVLIDNQVRALLVLNRQSRSFAREQLHMVLPHVNDVIGDSGGLLDRVHPRLQIVNVDLAVRLGDPVQIMRPVLNLGDAEVDAAQPGTVRAGFNQFQSRFGRVGKYEVGVLIRIDLHHANGVVNEIAVRRFQLTHLVGPRLQLREVDLAIDVGPKFLPVRAANLLELKAYIGQRFHRHAVHLDKVDARLQAVKEDQRLRPRLARFQLNLLGRGVDHMGIICRYFLHQIGARLQIIQENLAIAVCGFGIKQLGILIDLKGDAGQTIAALLIVFHDSQGGFALVGNSQNGIVLNSRIIGVNVDAMGRLIQHIPCRGRRFHDLNVRFLFDPGHIRLAGVVGGDRGDLLSVSEHIEGSAGEANIRIGVPLHNGKSNVPDVFKGDRHILGAVPFHRLYAGILLIAVRSGLLRYPVAAVGQFIALEGDGTVKAGGAGRFVGAVDLLKNEYRPLQGSLVLRVDLLDGKALFRIVRHRQVLCTPGGECDVHWSHNLVPLRGGGFCQGILFGRVQIGPNDLAVPVAGASDRSTLVAGERKLRALQRCAARTGLDDLEAGAVRSFASGPFEGSHRVAGGIPGVGHDIGLFGSRRVVGQKQIELAYPADGFNRKRTRLGCVIAGNTDLERAVVFTAICIQVGIAVFAGVHLVAGCAVLLNSLQRRAVLRSKDSPLGGVCGVDLGGIAVDPGGGGGSHIHHAGVILPSADGFLFDAVCPFLSCTFQSIFIENINTTNILVLLRPQIHPGIKVLCPAIGQSQDCLYAVKYPDLLGVRGGFHQRRAAGGERGAGDGELAAGGPHRHLRGILVLCFGQAGNATNIPSVKFLELLQRPLRIPIGERAHSLGVPVIFLQCERLAGGDCAQPPVDAVGGTGQSLAAGVAPAAAA